MNILFLVRRTFPSLSPQAILLEKILRELVRDKKFRIWVLCETLDPEIPTGVLCSAYRTDESMFLSKIFDRIGGSPYSFFRIRYSNLIKATEILVARHGIDIIVCFSNPYYLNIAGVLVGKKLSIPVVSHYSDPILCSPYINWTRRAYRQVKAKEQFVICNSKTIVFNNRQMAIDVFEKQKTPIPSKVQIIPHSFDPKMFEKIAKSPSSENGKTIIVRHVGSLYGVRKPDIFFSVVSMLREREPSFLTRLRIEFIGAELMGRKVKIENLISEWKLDDVVSLIPVVNYETSLQLMKEADLLLLLDSSKGSPIFLPSKMIDYLGASRPVLALTPRGSPVEELAKRAGYFYADVNDVKMCFSALMRALNNLGGWVANPSLREEYSVRRVAQRWKHVLLDALRE